SEFWRQVPIREGRLPRPDEVWVVVLGSDAAAALSKRVGDTVELMWRRFEVVGISSYDNPLNSGAILAPLAALYELEHSAATVTAFLVHLTTPGDARAVEETLARLNALAPNMVFVRAEDV